MSEDTGLPRTFRLRRWLVEPDLNRLRDGEEACQLEPRVMALLLALARRRGGPVTHEELIAEVWDGAHLAAGAVKHLIWQLRRDLGDDARSPSYVASVPRRGYRLVAAVEPAVPSVTRRRRVAAGLASVALTMTVAWIALAARRDDMGHASPETHMGRFSALPLTAHLGNEIDPSLSPDSRQVVYAWDGGATGFDLWTQELAGTLPRRLTELVGDERNPVWTPDGNTIVFIHRPAESDRPEILSLPASGGRTRRWQAEGLGSPIDLAVAPGADEAVVSTRGPGDRLPSLVVVPLGGGVPRQLTRPPNNAGDFDPAISADGAYVAFRRRFGAGVDDLFVVSLRGGGPPRRLTHDRAWILGLAFTADGDEVVFSSDRVPPRGLWRVPLAGGTPRWAGVPGGFHADPVIGGDTLVYQELRCDANLWRASLPGPAEAAGAAWEDLVSTRLERSPRFSPDGRTIAFLSDRGGALEIWVAPDGGGAPRRVTDAGAAIHSFAWSPDGEQLTYDARVNDDADVYLVPRSGGSARRLTGPPDNEISPSFSADGRAILFASDRGGEWRIWRQPLAGGPPTAVTAGRAGRVGPDGGTLYALRDGGGLWALSAAATRARSVLAPPVPLAVLDWHAGREGSLYAAVGGGRSDPDLVRVDVATGVVERLRSLDGLRPYPPGIAVSPDETTVVWTRFDTAASDLQVVRGFR